MTATVLDLAKRIRDGQFLPASCGQHRRYQKGCRGCQRSAADRNRAHERAAAYGWRRPEKLLPADRARAHLEFLHTEHRMSYRRIAALAGTAQAPVQKIATGVQQNATETTITAILGVQPDGLRYTERGNVLTVGAARRLQGLMHQWYRAEDLAPLLRTDPETVRRWRRCYFPSITLRRHEQIADLADRLEGTRGPSRIAHLRAVANGWVALAAWDDVDDPGETPAPDPDGPDELPDLALVDRVLHDHANYDRLNESEKVALWWAWVEYRIEHGLTYGSESFARRFAITKGKAAGVRMAALGSSNDSVAADSRTHRMVA